MASLFYFLNIVCYNTVMRYAMLKQTGLLGPALIGFLSAILFLVLAYTTITKITPEVTRPPAYYFGALIIFPALCSFGMLVLADLAKKFGEKFGVLVQFYKFVLVGVLNTFLDLAVLNGLIVLSGITVGWQFSLFKGISFAAAVINSYFWNKLWTFSVGGKAKPVEFSKFLAVSLVGLGINVGVASFLVNIVGPLGAIKPQLWASMSAIAAIGFTTISNFAGYKLFVFKKQ